jgi:hypothetical protein
MTLHYAAARALSGFGQSGWRASCQCGWSGPHRRAKGTADADADRHNAAARPPGHYA